MCSIVLDLRALWRGIDSVSRAKILLHLRARLSIGSIIATVCNLGLFHYCCYMLLHHGSCPHCVQSGCAPILHCCDATCYYTMGVALTVCNLGLLQYCYLCNVATSGIWTFAHMVVSYRRVIVALLVVSVCDLGDA